MQETLDEYEATRVYRGARFRLGELLITANAATHVDRESYLEGLSRHAKGDWGEVNEEDQAANNRALVEGTRLLSAYKDSQGTKYRIITEADRSVTTVLMPEDY